MSEFSVDTKSLFEAAADLNKLFYQCDSIVQEMDQIISCFHYQINSDGYDNEINCLIIQSANLKNSRENLASAANTLQKIAECYEEVAVPQSFWAEWKENCEKKFSTSIRNAFIGRIGKGMNWLAGTINTWTAIAKTEGENAFYMLDSTVLAKTGVHAVIGQAGGKLGTIAGLAITANMVSIMSTVLGIAEGAVVLMGVGAVAGVVIGLGITVLGNMFFDRCYDEWRNKKRWEVIMG